MDKIIIEIRAGDGGDDAKLFLYSHMLPMYTKYCKQLSFKVEVLEESDSTIVLQVIGKDAQAYFSLEPGIHRLQRVPPTEKRGRRQSSIVYVTILPIVNNPAVKLDLNDVEIVPFRASGPGGQHRNKVETAIRVKHIPTGITAISAFKSQYQNKILALEVLQSRLSEIAKRSLEKKKSKTRKQQLSNNLAKVRTYNFIEDRCTDIRIKRKYKNSEIMKGRLDLIYKNVSDND